ncbi:MAG: hypothetical protein KGS10_04465 [Chloroflexi bacterium]|nr:hypothetical protein [Chloroflexota bacterium]
MSEKMYRVRGDRTRSPGWWASAASVDWPALIAPARSILDGDEALLSLDAAEAFRRWAVCLPGWPARPSEGAPPISFSMIGYADAGGAPRKRWPIALFTTERERDALEAAARRAGLTVGSYLRELALAGEREE